jgi:hypothetical protein
MTKIEGLYFAIIEKETQVVDFPVVVIDGKPAIYDDIEDAKRRLDSLKETQGDQFELVQLDAKIHRHQESDTDV